MPDDVDEHVAQMFHGLVSDLQRSDVEEFERRQVEDREKRAALRAQQEGRGMTAGELLKQLDGDPAAEMQKIQDELTKLTKDAQAAASKKASVEPLPDGHFPAPPTSGSSKLEP